MRSFVVPLLLLVPTISPSGAEELEAEDVPAACATICGPVVLLSNACDVDFDDDDDEYELSRRAESSQQHDPDTPTMTTYAPPRSTAGHRSSRRRRRSDAAEDQAERFCMCRNTSFDVAGVTALCASCLAQNQGPSDGVEDINEIMSECAFSSTTYAPSATESVKDITIVAMIPTLPTASTSGAPAYSGDSQSGGGSALGATTSSSSSSSSWGTTGRQSADSRSLLYLFGIIALAMALL